MMRVLTSLTLFLCLFYTYAQNDWDTATSGQITYAGGEVGIGTTSPNAILDVRTPEKSGVLATLLSNGGINSGSEINKWTIRMGRSFDYPNRILDFGMVSDSYGQNPDFFVAPGGTEVFRIKENGSVGIGTPSPDIKLEVFQNSGESTIAEFRTPDGSINIAAAGPLTENSSYGNYISSRNANNTGYEDFGLKTAVGNPQLIVKTSGSVGIGTSNPLDKLHVYSSSSGGSSHSFSDLLIEDNDRGMMQILTSSTGKGYYGFADNDDQYVGGIQYEHANDKMIFRVNNHTSDMAIASSGNIGIGTTTPIHKLEVNGTIRSKEVKVEASPWPDYVFEEDYNLRSLEETEAYIQKNKHLPEIPSAQEMEANGVQLGEMNRLLLKKIEELTLHVIALKKENEAQQKEIDSLKSESK